ncbi:SRPBCC family protein [Pengzhenrongella sicca]|uniref:SRPBCC domain-containing protein n=1 Tax=Pengzhenrongella sicca TaxID=2819238 RepID=A0A8A4ZGM9_9MICO|nr:SRPBCC domain-containing protein [Pengzhenrongella sicca]QTE30149.1 SRPBCC domain-containing protein [Pengzhenrongella sicca]
MTVISTTPDTAALTLTIVADLAAAPKRAWQLWEDPRQLERWWGPPTWPATFVQHDVVVGGRSGYYMTGPDGSTGHGWWQFLSVDEPRSLEFEDGFADDAGTPDPSMPTTRSVVELEETAAGTRMTITSHFATLEQMEQLVQMGVVEGLTLALGQIDGILAGG